MNIVHVVYSLEMGGAEVMVAHLCRIQRAHGHRVSVFAYSNLGVVGERLRSEGFDVYVPGPANPLITMARYFRRFTELQPDVVHCHNPAPTLQAALPARLASVRRVLSTRHSLVAPPYDRAAEIKYSLLATFCDRIVGICDITCDNLRHAPLAHRDKITRVYNGTPPLDTSQPVPAEIAAAAAPAGEAKFILLFVGRLAEVKDLGTLIRSAALARASVPNLELWIVGGGPVRPTLEALAASLNASDIVRFWGEQLDTAPYFAQASAFAMSSVSEGLPMSLLQAMSLGLPALTTDVGGMAEVLRLSQSGLLTPVGDFAAMATSIATLATNPTLRDTFSARAREAYTTHFTLEQMHEAYMRLYNAQ